MGELKKEFIPYEQSLALKQLGFDEPCFGEYYYGKLKYDEVSNGQTAHNDLALAPTFSQAFRWFREKHKIISVIGFYCDGDAWEDVGYEVAISAFEDFATHDTFVRSGYISYEEAELACLIKLIEIVKTK
jgi:hypothetical protein